MKGIKLLFFRDIRYLCKFSGNFCRALLMCLLTSHIEKLFIGCCRRREKTQLQRLQKILQCLI